MNLIFFGIQGSGKGTQAKLLAADHGYTIFETGAELRTLSKEDSELGRKVKTTIESGQLVSTELVMDIVEAFIVKHSNDKIIFDGIPRSEDQNAMFRKRLAAHNIKAVGVHFILEKDEAVARLLKRAEIEGRADDNEESIKQRLQIFFDKTVPVIETFANDDTLIEIDAKQSIDDVYSQLTSSIENYAA
jgi:adenylate kinase